MPSRFINQKGPKKGRVPVVSFVFLAVQGVLYQSARTILPHTFHVKLGVETALQPDPRGRHA